MLNQRIRILWLRLQLHLFNTTGAIGDYFTITRTAADMLLIANLGFGLIVGPLVGGFLYWVGGTGFFDPSWGNAISTLAIIVGATLGFIVAGRLGVAATLGIDLPEGLIPESVRRNISFLQGTPDDPDKGLGKGIFQGLSLGMLWMNAAVLIPAMLPVWEYWGLYLFTIALIAMLCQYLGYAWIGAKHLTEALRWLLVAMLTWAILSMFMPAYRVPLAILIGATGAYITALFWITDKTARTIITKTIGIVTVLALLVYIFGGIAYRLSNRSNKANTYHSLEGDREKAENDAVAKRHKELNATITDLRTKVIGGTKLTKDEQEKLDKAEQEKVNLYTPAPSATTGTGSGNTTGTAGTAAGKTGARDPNDPVLGPDFSVPDIGPTVEAARMAIPSETGLPDKTVNLSTLFNPPGYRLENAIYMMVGFGALLLLSGIFYKKPPSKK
jgi:hypothetical protein